MTEFWRSAELPELEMRRSCQENSCYRPHAHDALSIGIIDEGSSIFTGPDGAGCELVPGNVVIIPAGRAHSCNPDAGRWVYRMIHMDQAWVDDLMPELAHEPLLTHVTVLRDAVFYEQLCGLTDEIFAGLRPEHIGPSFARVFRELRRASLVATIVGTAARPRHGADEALDVRLAPVFARLREDAQNPSLQELGEAVGMDRHQLSRAVRRLTGLAPLAWRQNSRVQRARRMLREGHTIAETAHALGFADQSHFHRVFKAHVAASPGSYRA